jgi:hypothetical protein
LAEKYLFDLFCKHGRSAHAIRVYCIPSDLRDTFRSLQTTNLMKNFTGSLAHEKHDTKSQMQSFWDMVAEDQTLKKKKDAILAEGAHRAVATIRVGRLRVFGFQKPRKVTDLPHDLSEHAKVGRIDWESNAMSYQSMNFVDLSFIFDDEMYDLRESSKQVVNPTTAPRRGRPPKVLQIRQVVEECMIDGSYDVQRTMQSQYSFIRSHLLHRFPDMMVNDTTPSNETIRKVIVAVLLDPTQKQ